MAILRNPTTGKIMRKGGKILRGEAGTPCCCCCECTPENRAGLASSYFVDLSGTWTFAGGGTPCEGSTAEVRLELDEELCLASFEDGANFSTCIDGKYLQVLVLNLSGCVWTVEVVFYDVDGQSGGVSIVYTQTVKNCADPTGEYSNPILSSGGPFTAAPPTVTVN